MAAGVDDDDEDMDAFRGVGVGSDEINATFDKMMTELMSELSLSQGEAVGSRTRSKTNDNSHNTPQSANPVENLTRLECTTAATTDPHSISRGRPHATAIATVATATALTIDAAGASSDDGAEPTVATAPFVATTESSSEASQLVRLGISMEGLERFVEHFNEQIDPTATTGDVCHTVIKPATVPPGWTAVPTLVDAVTRW